MDIVEKIMKIAKPPRPEDLYEARYRKEHKEELRAEAKRKLAERRKKRLRAERKAIERYPITAENGERAFLARGFFVKGYEQAEKDILSIIESRLSELLGDAQPTPILRYELRDLIKKIKEENNG